MYFLADSKPSCLLSDFKPDPGLVLVRAGKVGWGWKSPSDQQVCRDFPGASSCTPPSPHPAHLSSFGSCDSQLLSIGESLGK